MTLFGAVDQLLLGGSDVRYGVVFVLVSVACAVWVRPVELIAAPIVVPIAFAAGLLFTGDLVEILTALALRAPWLYGGTLVAVLVVLARKRATSARTRAS